MAMPSTRPGALPPTPVEKATDPDYGTELIPKERYTSRDYAAREWERMWTKTWLMAGREADLPEPGSYATFEIGTESILLIRQADRSIAARYNVCMHRGNRLVEPGRGHAKYFKCLFHAWVYNTDGSLRQATDAHCFPQGIPRERLAMQPLRCDTWGGFVFVNLDPDAGPLRDYLGVIPRHLDPYHFEDYEVDLDLSLEVDCNWKTCVDAFNEAYHVQGTHPEMLEYSDDVDCPIDVYGPHSRFRFRLAKVSPRLASQRGRITPTIKQWFLAGAMIDPESYQGELADVRGDIARAKRERLGPALGIDFSDLSDEQLNDDYHYTLFPNVTFNISAMHAWVFRHRPHPDDPNKMFFDFWNIQRRGKRDIPRAEPVRAHASEVDYEALMGVSGQVIAQDMHNLPRIQAGMRSSSFPGLFLGTQELRIRAFHDTLERYLADGGSAPAA